LQNNDIIKVSSIVSIWFGKNKFCPSSWNLWV